MPIDFGPRLFSGFPCANPVVGVKKIPVVVRRADAGCSMGGCVAHVPVVPEPEQLLTYWANGLASYT